MTRKGGSYTRASMEEISITAIVDHREVDHRAMESYKSCKVATTFNRPSLLFSSCCIQEQTNKQK